MQTTWQINNSANDNSRLLFLVGYLYDEKKVKYFFNITNSYDFRSLTVMRKKSFLMELTKMHNKYITIKGLDFFHSPTKIFFAVIQVAQNITRVFKGRVQRLFIPQFYLNRKNFNFLRELKFKGEKKEIDEKNFSEDNLLGRKLYEYYSPVNYYIRPLNRNNSDWPFPDSFYVSIGYTVHGFSFTFISFHFHFHLHKNTGNNLSTILNPSNDLLNVESGLEEVENTLIDESFYTVKKLKKK